MHVVMSCNWFVLYLSPLYSCCSNSTLNFCRWPFPTVSFRSVSLCVRVLVAIIHVLCRKSSDSALIRINTCASFFTSNLQWIVFVSLAVIVVCFFVYWQVDRELFCCWLLLVWCLYQSHLLSLLVIILIARLHTKFVLPIQTFANFYNFGLVSTFLAMAKSP